MTRTDPYAYEYPATDVSVREFFADVSPMESLPSGLDEDAFVAATHIADARYAVRLDGRLMVIALVYDKPGWRKLVVLKTAYLTTSRRITYARTIPFLLDRLTAFERMRARDGMVRGPLYFTTEDGDVRSQQWFEAAGCTITDHGVHVPDNYRREH